MTGFRRLNEIGAARRAEEKQQRLAGYKPRWTAGERVEFDFPGWPLSQVGAVKDVDVREGSLVYTVAYHDARGAEHVVFRGEDELRLPRDDIRARFERMASEAGEG